MKKLLFIFAISLMVSFITSCRNDDTPGPTIEFLLNEDQSNWLKRLLIQRPLSNVSEALPGEYCETNTGILYVKGDTVTAYASLRLFEPLTYIFTSQNAGSTWTMQGTQNGFILSAVQIGETSFALREYLSSTDFGFGMQYGGSWTWADFTGDAKELRLLNKDTLYAFGNDGIRVSANGGVNWMLKNTQVATDIQNYDNNTLIGIFGNNIMTSDDLGSNWAALYSATQTLKTLCKNHDGNWFAGGNAGCVVKSIDNGANWTQKFILTQIYSTAATAQTMDIHFLDSNNGFAAISCPTVVNCGDDFNEMAGCILRTLDGGETWSVNYRTEFIRYSNIDEASGPNVMATGTQYRDNYVSGIYVTLTTTFGN